MSGQRTVSHYGSISTLKAVVLSALKKITISEQRRRLEAAKGNTWLFLLLIFVRLADTQETNENREQNVTEQIAMTVERDLSESSCLNRHRNFLDENEIAHNLHRIMNKG